ncbi:helix-turn-helix domain-containing protein [Actinokineospora sp. 24-640]
MRELGGRLRALRAARGWTVATVAADADLSVPYIANLENGRGNPTVEALARLAAALGTRFRVDLVPEDTAAPATTAAAPLPPALVRLSRGTRFRRDLRLMAEHLGEDPTATSARTLDALARLGAVSGRELSDPDWHRLMDALVLVALHPNPGK